MEVNPIRELIYETDISIKSDVFNILTESDKNKDALLKRTIDAILNMINKLLKFFDVIKKKVVEILNRDDNKEKVSDIKKRVNDIKKGIIPEEGKEKSSDGNDMSKHGDYDLMIGSQVLNPKLDIIKMVLSDIRQYMSTLSELTSGQPMAVRAVVNNFKDKNTQDLIRKVIGMRFKRSTSDHYEIIFGIATPTPLSKMSTNTTIARLEDVYDEIKHHLSQFSKYIKPMEDDLISVRNRLSRHLKDGDIEQEVMLSGMKISGNLTSAVMSLTTSMVSILNKAEREYITLIRSAKLYNSKYL